LPQALFCLNDIAAIGALKACRDLGIDVPGDLAVLGTDDTPSVSYCLGLSTIRHPIGDLARAVCDTVLRGIDEPEASLADTALATILMLRSTT
jgi:DNA-binding LacI/PurR family transcriptional regulator